MLIGYQKCKPSLDSRIPITPAILIQLVNDLQHTSSSAFLCCLLRAMFILAFCAFLRVGEITKTTGSSQHFLLFEHISIHTGVDHLQLIDNNIPHFKHSKSNVTTLRLHQNTKNPVICPWLALTQYLQLRKHGSPSEPLFSFMDELPVSKQFFTHHLRTALAFCNLDLQRYQSHSFRIGAATTAASWGFSEIQIQKMDRWRFNAFKKCIRIPTLNLWVLTLLSYWNVTPFNVKSCHANRGCMPIFNLYFLFTQVLSCYPPVRGCKSSSCHVRTIFCYNCTYHCIWVLSNDGGI